MADTRPDIVVPVGERIDIYAALNAQAGFPAVATGTKIRVINKGATDVFLYSSASSPSSIGDGVPLPMYATGTNEQGDAGAFVTCTSIQGIINVAVVS